MNQRRSCANESTRGAPGGAATMGGAIGPAAACASITRRVLRGLVGAASDRGITELAAVEADLAAYLDQRYVTEHWADTVAIDSRPKVEELLRGAGLLLP